MKFKELIYNNTSLKEEHKIIKILHKEGFHWLIDSETENASIEIVNNTIIWNSGDFYSGHWHYGIWKDGNFYGIWENGIFENGKFDGKFISGIKSQSVKTKK
jgi:hypothetical protein